ncbi:ubiquinol-cytochrome C chaperone family protein [Sphingorhabdus sp. EL138]|uniref:ubiquinol-cytochrome C chaperone family protein n=1 Tax=Sphingorhabdus sp. EL138 TaxID=2073156 RepID=UPI0025EBE970|nr:ubiquinol-cytochrome C chaperone family protein [Sphingorhabdus sp. EL138]
MSKEEYAVMTLLKRLFGNGQPDPKIKLVPLYNQIVAKAREPHWYIEGAVPDSLDGRFDMVAAILSLVLLRLEESKAHALDMARLTEVFVDDMDGQLREVGIGDMIVGKHIGQIMGAVGGRLGALRNAMDDHSALDDALVRNLYRSAAPSPDALAHTRQGLLDVERALGAQLPDMLIEGAAKW